MSDPQTAPEEPQTPRRRWRGWLLAGLLITAGLRLALSPFAHQIAYVALARVTTGPTRLSWLERLDSDHPLSREALLAAALEEGTVGDWALREVEAQGVALTPAEVRVFLDLGGAHLDVARRQLPNLPEAQRWPLLEAELNSPEAERRALAIAALSQEKEAPRVIALARARLAREDHDQVRAGLCGLIYRRDPKLGALLAAELLPELEGEPRGLVVQVIAEALTRDPTTPLPEGVLATCEDVIAKPPTTRWSFDLGTTASWVILVQAFPGEVGRVAQSAPPGSQERLASCLSYEDFDISRPAVRASIEALTPILRASEEPDIARRIAISRLRLGIAEEEDRACVLDLIRRDVLSEGSVDAIIEVAAAGDIPKAALREAIDALIRARRETGTLDDWEVESLYLSAGLPLPEGE